MLKLIGAVFFTAVCVLSAVMARKGLSARRLLSSSASTLAAHVVAESLAGVALACCLGLIWINHALAVHTG